MAGDVAWSQEEAGSDSQLYVRRSDEQLARFDPQQIVEALVREAHVDVELATKISLEVKEAITHAGIRTLNSSLIRELVNVKLLEYGLEAAYRAHSRLGVPLYDADRIIRQSAREQDAPPHGPEGTSLVLAEAIKREYAIREVFSEAVAEAHLAGAIHIQGLGMVDRPYALASSVDYLKRYGIVLPHGFASARPARHPEVLLAHVVKFSAALHGYLAGPVVWDSLNVALAPYLVGAEDRDLRQLAQALMFELSAPAVARGGQVVACDVHLDWEVPAYLASRPALGPQGEETGEPYAAYGEVARRFLRQLLEVYREGDAEGRPFLTPRLVLHLTDRFATIEGYREFLKLLCDVLVHRGGVRLVFDRDETRSFFLRFGVPFEVGHERAETWRWRTAVLQAIAVNLPRIGYHTEGDVPAFFEQLTHVMELAAQAHLEKRIFLEKLMALGESGPLALLALRRSEKAFLKLAWTTHLLCPFGLDEAVWMLTGKHLHESDQAVEMALRITSHLMREAERLSAKHKVRFIVADSTDEVAAARLARLDLRSPFAARAAATVSGDVERNEVYYSRPFKVLPQAAVRALERVRIEGLLHDLGPFGVTTPIWLGEKATAAEPLAALISRGFFQTHSAGILLAPEFTLCMECGRYARGLHKQCPYCYSSRLDGLALGTYAFGRLSTWNRGLLAEWRHRYRVDEDLG
ncbi:MAG: anaerobic ribonucleoside-triphosphate reductase [Blastocatellia bacterium]|nr:anaerobic ribonucleoside-triphosphate reductase [Blastocatellia bacterium]